MNLEFNETLQSAKCGNFYILLQSYTNVATDEDIFNVAIECMEDDEFISHTIDIYENKDLMLAQDYYNELLRNIQETNIIR